LPHSSFGKGIGCVSSALLRFIKFLFNLSDLSLSPLSEDFLESWDYSGYHDDLLDKLLNIDFEFIVSRIVDDLPVRVRSVKDSIYPEDWDDLLSLLVTNDMLSEV